MGAEDAIPSSGGVSMLFAVTWVPTGTLSEDRDKRTLRLFTNWQPPAGVEFKGFYDYADGNGGIAIVEAGSAEALLETTAPWAAFFSFTIRPLVTSERGVGIFENAIKWRDSIR
jgi:hypothetical protein